MLGPAGAPYVHQNWPIRRIRPKIDPIGGPWGDLSTPERSQMAEKPGPRATMGAVNLVYT